MEMLTKSGWRPINDIEVCYIGDDLADIKSQFILASNALTDR